MEMGSTGYSTPDVHDWMNNATNATPVNSDRTWTAWLRVNLAVCKSVTECTSLHAADARQCNNAPNL